MGGGGGRSKRGGARRSISILFCVWPFLLLDLLTHM